MTTSPVLSLADIPLKSSSSRGEKFAAQAGRIGAAVGLKKLGAQYYIVPPGKVAAPFHSHLANDELYLVLEGEGRYRFGDESHDVRAGDVMGAPAGGAETAHQLANTGDIPLKYIVFSTRNDPDVCLYPDSDKFLVAARVPDGGGMLSAGFHHIGRTGQSLDYYDGEET